MKILTKQLTHTTSCGNCLTKILKMQVKKPDSKLHRAYYYYLHNHPLQQSHFINVQQKFMVDNLRRHGINTFGKLKDSKEGNDRPRIQLESFQIWHSFPIFPRHWRQIISISQRALDFFNAAF